MAEPTERIAILLELQQQEFEKRAKSAGAAIDRLERKFNPVAAAEAKLEKQQLRMNAALEAGTIDAAKHAKGMDLLQREYDQTVTKLTGARNNVVALNSSVAAQTGFMTRNRSVFQQAGYQVGDFAVQVQGGTSAITAFTQQGSQLLGVFGPWGAVMGAVLAVGAPLAAVILGLGDASEETKEKAKTFTDRVEEANSALAAMDANAASASEGGLEALRKKYGELTDEVKTMVRELYEIDKRVALEAVSAVISEVTGEVAKAAQASSGAVAGALAAAGTEAGRAEAQAFRAEVEAIQTDIAQRQSAGMFVTREELDILAEMKEQLAALEGDFASIGNLASEITVSPDLLMQIGQAQEGLEAARDAGDFSAMADQLGIIRGLLEQAGETVSQDVLDGITKSEAVARDMAERLADAEAAANGIEEADISGGIGAGADEAARLAKNLGISLETAQRLAALGPQGGGAGPNEAGKVYSGRGGDPRSVGGSALDWQVQDADDFISNWKPPSASSASGGGSSGSSRGRKQAPLFEIAEGELEKLQRQIELMGKSKSEIAELIVKHKLLDEAKKRGLEITEELTAKIDAEAAEVGELAEKYELARDKVAAMEEIQSTFEDSVVSAAMGGVDAMDQFTDAIKRAALEYVLFGKGMFASGGSSGGGFGGSLGGVGSALFGGSGGGLFSFDGGGYTGAGARSGGIDGRGGFPAILHPNETVVDHTRVSGSAQSGVVDVRVTGGELMISDDGQLMAKVKVVAESSTAAGLKRVPSIMDDHQRRMR